METKSKQKIMMTGILVAIAATLIFYVPTIVATQTDTSPEPYGIANMMSEHSWIKQECSWRNDFHCKKRWNWISSNSETVTIDGTVVGLVRNRLALDVEDGQIRVLLPPVWSVDMGIIRVKALLDNGFLVQGENVTVKALKTSLIAEEDYSVYILFGYELINSTDSHAFAVLPFNIES